MKYSQTAGIIASLALIGVCFLPWSFIDSQQLTITGMDAQGTNFGSPGLMNIIFSAMLIIFFFIPKIWSKRINVLIAALNIAWAFRNFILVTSCDGGECPEKREGIYLLLALSAIILLMTLIPKLPLPEEE